MLKVKTYIAPSSIEGIGLFADEDIKKDSIIWEFDEGFDLKIPKDKLERISDIKKAYLMKMGWFQGDELYVCCDNATFINHSETPNISEFCHELFATRDILKDEEIVEDYKDMDVKVCKDESGNITFKI